MDIQKIGFLNNNVIISKINEQILVHVFVESYSKQNNTFLACGNVEIVKLNMPVYGIGTVCLQLKNISLLDKVAYVKFYYPGGESVLQVDLVNSSQSNEFSYDEIKRMLMVNNSLLDTDSIQILGDNKKLKPFKKEENHTYFNIPNEVCAINLKGRFYDKSISISQSVVLPSVDKVYNYEIVYEYEKAVLKLDCSQSDDKTFLIEGDFKGFKEFSDGQEKTMSISNNIFFKYQKEFIFTINGQIQKGLLIKPSAYPNSVSWIASQNKLKFNRELAIPTKLLVNGLHTYEVDKPIVEYVLDKHIIPYSVMLVENINGTVLLEKQFEKQIISSPKSSLPLLIIDSLHRKIRLDSMSKQVIQINIAGMPAIFFQPGEVAVDFPYHFYKNKGVVKFTIDSFANCIVSSNTFYILL